MSEETKEDIVREMRMGSTGDMPCAYIVGMPDTIEEFPCGGKVPKINIKRVTVDELADRFEAAFERELVGNKAAARATLRYILNQIDNNPDRLSAGNLLCVIGDKAQATLAKPARNCDNYDTKHEAKRAWFLEEVQPRLDGKRMDHEEIPFFDWLFEKAKKGGEA
jgi:hypothetical protein